MIIMTVDINDLSYFGDTEPIIFGLKFHIILHCSQFNVESVEFCLHRLLA